MEKLPVYIMLLTGVASVIVGILFELAILAVFGYLVFIIGLLILGSRNALVAKTIETVIQIPEASEIHMEIPQTTHKRILETVEEELREEKLLQDLEMLLHDDVLIYEDLSNTPPLLDVVDTKRSNCTVLLMVGDSSV